MRSAADCRKVKYVAFVRDGVRSADVTRNKSVDTTDVNHNQIWTDSDGVFQPRY